MIDVRAARPADAQAITAVLTSAYPGLMAADYDPAVLAAALPAMTRANPGLLASGTYHVQETSAGRIVSCGGWTREAPGTGETRDGVAHIRHFATHVDWIRQGLGTGIFQRCRQQARAAGIETFECLSTLGAEPFYTSLGFDVVERTETRIGGGMKLPTITMVWTHRSTAR